MRSIWIFFKPTPAANTQYFFCPLHQNKLKPMRHWALISTERGKSGRSGESGGQGERNREDDQSGKKPDGGRLGAVQDLMSLWSACLDSKHPNGTTTDRKKNKNTTTDLPLRPKRKTKFMLVLDRLVNIKKGKYTHGLQTHLKYCLYVPLWGDV